MHKHGVVHSDIRGVSESCDLDRSLRTHRAILEQRAHKFERDCATDALRVLSCIFRGQFFKPGSAEPDRLDGA